MAAISDSRLCLLLLMLAGSVMTGYALADNTLTEEEEQRGWQLLFDGNNMSQWRNFKKEGLNPEWVVENGTMQLTGKGGWRRPHAQDFSQF